MKSKEAQRRLLILKVLHTTVWVVMVAMILHILYSGLANRIGRLTWVSIAVVLVEGFVLVLFKWNCPITLVARKYSVKQEPGFDLFVPRFIVEHNKTIFTCLYLVGVLMVIVRALSSRG